MDTISIYITATNAAEARRIANALLQARLVACVNILGPIRSLYWWDERIADTKEVAMLCKSVRPHFPRIVALVKTLHSYQVPCITAWRIPAGNPEFLQWVAAETRQSRLRPPRRPERTRK